MAKLKTKDSSMKNSKHDIVTVDLDDVDIKLLKTLQKNSRCSFQNVARECNVSGGTIHVRADKLVEEGVIRNYGVQIDYEKLGFHVLAYVGVKINKIHNRAEFIEGLRNIPNIVETHSATGMYDLLIKIVTRTTRELHGILTEQVITLADGVSTETIICFDTPIDRSLNLDLVD